MNPIIFKNQLFLFALLLLMALVPSLAFAALDPAVATAFGDIETDFLAMMALVWPVIGTIVASLAIIGLVKKALNRGGVR